MSSVEKVHLISIFKSLNTLIKYFLFNENLIWPHVKET